MIFRQDVPSRYRAPVSPSRRLARSALPRERFRSLAHDVSERSAAKCPELRSWRKWVDRGLWLAQQLRQLGDVGGDAPGFARSGSFLEINR